MNLMDFYFVNELFKMENRINAIKTFEELSEKILIYGNSLSTYMRGHLIIDFLYRKILQENPSKYSNIEKLSHSKLIDAMYDLQYINNNEKTVLVEINRIRNRFAHDIAFSPSVTEIKILFKNAQNIFFEFFEGFPEV